MPVDLDKPRRCAHRPCGKPLPKREGPGRRSDYCDRGCQSKAYRAREAQARDAELARLKALAALAPTGPEAPGDVPDDDAQDPEPEETGLFAEQLPTVRQALLDQAAMVATVVGRFADSLEAGTDPDVARAGLRRRLPHLLARTAEQARLLAGEHRPVVSEDVAAGTLLDFADALLFRDSASVRYLHTVAGTDPDELEDQDQDLLDPLARLGPVTLVLPLTDPGLDNDWDLAGWHRQDTALLLRHHGRVRGRVELVGGNWLAARGDRTYLRERTRGWGGRLRRHRSAVDAAHALAHWLQDTDHTYPTADPDPAPAPDPGMDSPAHQDTGAWPTPEAEALTDTGTLQPVPQATQTVPTDPRLRLGAPDRTESLAQIGSGWRLARWSRDQDAALVLFEDEMAGWVERGATRWLAVHDGRYVADAARRGQVLLHRTELSAARTVAQARHAAVRPAVRSVPVDHETG
jgi:hypothetical protein